MIIFRSFAILPYHYYSRRLQRYHICNISQGVYEVLICWRGQTNQIGLNVWTLFWTTNSPYKHAHFYICTFHALKMNCIKTQCYLEIDLVTVFDAILTSRQTREKLQWLYENLMSNNFRKTAVLNKISIVNLSYKAKDCPKKIWGRTCA